MHLHSWLAPFNDQSENVSVKLFLFEVSTTRCWISLHVRFGLQIQFLFLNFWNINLDTKQTHTYPFSIYFTLHMFLHAIVQGQTMIVLKAIHTCWKLTTNTTSNRERKTKGKHATVNKQIWKIEQIDLNLLKKTQKKTL